MNDITQIPCKHGVNVAFSICPDCFELEDLRNSRAGNKKATEQGELLTSFLLTPRMLVGTFQAKVKPWLDACFGKEIAEDKVERNHRFLEEALELVQTCGCTSSEAHQLVDYVYGRPVGEIRQELGGVMVTLAALALANEQDMQTAGYLELERIWTKVEIIRAKQKAKPKHSPLPE